MNIVKPHLTALRGSVAHANEMMTLQNEGLLNIHIFYYLSCQEEYLRKQSF